MRESFLLRPVRGAYPGDPKINHCIVEPGAPREIGGNVFILFRSGHSEIATYLGRTSDDWTIILTADGQMISRLNPAALHAVLPITWSGTTPPPTLTQASNDNRLSSYADQLQAIALRMRQDAAGG